MGFLDDFINGFTSSTSKSSTKTGKTIQKVAKAIATTQTGKKKETEIATPIPKILTTKWVNKKGEEVSKAKYGKEISLSIKTEDANRCWLFVSINCDNWEKPLRKLVKIEEWTMVPVASKYTKISLTPLIEWSKNKSIEEIKLQAETWVVWQQFMNDFELKEYSSNDFALEELEFHLRAKKRDFQVNNFIFIKHNKKSQKAKEINLEKIVIVIDPGHGYDKEEQGGNIGSGAYKYTYKSLDETREITNRADEVPQYVVDNPNKYIIKKKIKRKEKTVEVQSVGDHSTNSKHLLERIIVFKVSKLLKLELENMGYKAWLTRDKETLIGYEGVKTRNMRVDFSNDKNADYFISVHYDGNEYNILLNGAHIQYHPSLEIKGFENQLIKNKTLGNAILQSYCKKMGITNKGVAKAATGVIGRSNKAEHKILIELAYVTNPSDAKKLFSEQQYPLMAEGIAEGFRTYIENND